MNVDKQLESIQKILEDGNPDVLQKLYRETSGSTLVTQQDIMKIWYGITPLSKCSDAVLNVLADVLGEYIIELPEDIVADHQAFLEDQGESSVTKKRCKSMFDSFKGHEARLKQDFSMLSKEDAIRIVESMGVYNITYMQSNLLYLNKYCKWRIKTGRPVNEIWKSGQAITVSDIDFSVAMKEKCYGDPYDLYSKIRSSCDTDDGYLAPVIAVLAWMGFSREEMIKIKNSDVDFKSRTVCGVEIPMELESILSKYFSMTEVPRPAGYGMRRMYLEDIGYFIKRVTTIPNGQPVTEGYLSTALSMSNLIFKDIQSSSRYYQMREIEKTRKLTKADVNAIWASEQYKNRIVEYQFWCKAFPKLPVL